MDRTCKKCGETKPIEEFRKNKRRKLGYDTICKKCDNEWCRIYKVNNREKRLDSQRRYHLKHRDEILKKQHKYRLEHKKEISEKGAEYYKKIKNRRQRYHLKHRDEILKKQHKYRLEHKKEISEKGAEYYKKIKNRRQDPQHLAIRRDRYKQNHEKERERDRKWKLNNQDKLKKERKARIIQLTDRYIISAISHATKLQAKTIRQNPELIENYRKQIELKRKLKSIKHENIKTS